MKTAVLRCPAARAAQKGADCLQQPPTAAQLEKELQRVQQRRRCRSALRCTVYTLLVAAAAAVLLVTLWLPVLRIYGSSMTPALHSGDLLLTVKTDALQRGDIIAFYCNNVILVKRVIGLPGDWIDLDADGTVRVNGQVWEEPYLDEKALGECNITLPFQVPDGRWFVLGDHRSTSVDSRHTAVGCVSQEQLVGRVVFRLWPLKRLGGIQ